MVIVEEPTQPLATLYRLLVTRLRDPTEQQDVGLPLMIPLGLVMRHILTQRSPQGALTKDNDLRQTLLLDRSHPAIRDYAALDVSLVRIAEVGLQEERSSIAWVSLRVRRS